MTEGDPQKRTTKRGNNKRGMINLGTQLRLTQRCFPTSNPSIKQTCLKTQKRVMISLFQGKFDFNLNKSKQYRKYNHRLVYIQTQNL